MTPEPQGRRGEPAPADTPAADRFTRIRELLATLPRSRDRRLVEQMLDTIVELLTVRPDTVDLKIVAAALAEMTDAFAMFAPYEEVSKVTIFGSARTRVDDPLYTTAHNVAQRLAALGWMVITGAGPGIMQAAMEGAGRDNSIGVSIRLPFEQRANPVIDGDVKYVSMKYFFTRKLMLIKESRGFVCLPGGFGTLDETFELLTLTQTGKGVPVPIVFLDTPGDPYWETVHEFVEEQLVRRALVAPADTGLYLVTDDVDRAVAELVGFYANFDSMRYVGDLLVIRVQREVTDEQLFLLNSRFGHLCASGSIKRVPPLEPEKRDHDRIHLPRIGFVFAKHGYGELRALIDTLNGFVPR